MDTEGTEGTEATEEDAEGHPLSFWLLLPPCQHVVSTLSIAFVPDLGCFQRLKTGHPCFPPAPRSSAEDESGNGYFLKSRELKIQSKITLSIPRLKTLFRNWLIRGHASCAAQEGGGQVTGALGWGRAG